MRALLDVSVLIALRDADHVHHRTATRWLAAERSQGWASCPITQNGCIRIMSQPAYPNSAEHHRGAAAPRDVVGRPRVLAGRPEHRGRARAELAVDLRSRHVTDAYLLALAVRRRGRFITIDHGVDVGAVRGATARSLVVLD